MPPKQLGFWEVDLPKLKKLSTCVPCGDAIEHDEMRFRWCPLDEGNKAAGFYHLNCMAAACAKSSKIQKLSQATLRKAMGLTRSQRDMLHELLGTPGAASSSTPAKAFASASPMKAKKDASADSEQPAKKAKVVPDKTPALKATAASAKGTSPSSKMIEKAKAVSKNIKASAKSAAAGRFADIVAEPCDGLGPVVGVLATPRLPLQQAAVQTGVKDMDACGYLAAENGTKLAAGDKHGLDADEAGALNLYTMDSALYPTLNAKLRDRERPKLKPFFPLLRHLLTARGKLPKFKGTVWRGVKADLRASYPKGKELYWWSFSSTTKELSTLNNPMFLGKTGVRTIFNIQVVSGVDIMRYSVYQGESGEAEVLLFPGTKLKVVDAMDMGGGLYQVHLKEVSVPVKLMK